jgi:serine/threonine protein kinase
MPNEAVRRNVGQRECPELYKKGDVIGRKYEVQRLLGKGGFGVVYLVYNRETNSIRAVKTFRDELLADAAAREAFKKEALLWVNLDRHPFILAATWVDDFCDRLFVEMDYVAPNASGQVSLADHLMRGSPLSTTQMLKWAVEFCLGMEHAQAHGLKCHRDIKPSNILINQEGTPKLTDFGLAEAAEAAWVAVDFKGGSRVWRSNGENIAFSLLKNEGNLRCGTPGYMPPELYRGEGADIRSDIYSFGVVLWQMATGSSVPPFVVPYWGDPEEYLRYIYNQQMTGRVHISLLECSRVNSCVWPAIERCLRPKPAERWNGFAELRKLLVAILERTIGKKFQPLQVGEKTANFWVEKGSSLASLGRQEEGLSCFDQALAIDPRRKDAWSNKGTVLIALNRHEEAISCFDQALVIGPRDAIACTEKGRVLAKLGQFAGAIKCYDEALEIEPRYAIAWNNKGRALDALGQTAEALKCYDKALAIETRNELAWYNKIQQGHYTR